MSERDRNGVDTLPQRLVRTAARHAPSQLAERLEEEWLADLLCRTGHLSRLRFALGCYWAVYTILREHCTARAAAAATTASGGRDIAAAYARYDWPFLSRRTLVLLSILALHVALIYCLANGLASKIATVIVQPIQVLVDKPRARDEPPPPAPKPTLVHPRLDVPPPDLTLNVPPEPGQITQGPTQRVEPPVITTHPPAAPIPIRVTGGPGRNFPDTGDYYPTVSRRLGEMGSSVVRVCVDIRGRLTAMPRIAQSSGSVRLDEGAITLAKAGSGHYRPTTEDGRPVPSCYPFRITFTLR